MKYTKRRDRVVKGRTAKQKAHQKRYGAFREVPTTIEAMPTTSWWLGKKTHAELSAAAAAEQPRIAWSKCGRLADPKYAE